MLCFQQQGVEARIAVIPIKRDAVDNWVERNAGDAGAVIEVVTLVQISFCATTVELCYGLR
jgi:hypothetical protein